MGVSLTATNSKYSFDMSYNGFRHLRENLADMYDEEFGKLYRELNKSYIYGEKSTKETLSALNKLLENDRFKEEDADILDFFFASDCEGSTSGKTCKKLYDIMDIEKVEGKIFTYSAYSDGKDYEHLKDFFLECYSKRRKARWY